MPELPEVETVRRTLTELVAGRTIERVTVTLPRIIQRPAEPEQFADMLAGRRIETVERRGKFLRIVLDELVLVSHLRMEGRYGLYRTDEPVEKHTHVIFHFTDGTELRYKDVRQFGTMHIFLPGEEFMCPPLNKLGIEPLDELFTPESLRCTLGRRTTKIKPLLLNQQYIVGLGNIYVDEALFAAGIHPERTADTLKKDEWSRLHAAIVETLGRAVEAGGSSIKSYVNGQGEVGLFQYSLQVYGREEEPCRRCGSVISKSVVGGRGTHVCIKCQPLGRSRRAAAGKLSDGVLPAPGSGKGRKGKQAANPVMKHFGNP
ncbi:DNA-formamidopyrimidine glycosylase [Paenibacillus sambharensis]|uniref:Formamidopyrimidine-DNA glycosylase n=1 Tax=Paenibacillus sambharensis TaxID=1803190 RepID=A0A2W1LVP2_9BACL|nr:DNA-formamidopyrimidine glycosylase [Paenibacillus sambharensis]PZD95841.1 DNA-formamidopyrimidine glycosylase [Paenibacillus sambharensis]